MNMEDYTLVELRQLAKERDIKNVSKLKKEELIDLLSNNTDREDDKITDKEDEKSNIEYNNAEKLNGYKVTNQEDEIVEGILEVLPDGYGFLRGENYEFD